MLICYLTDDATLIRIIDDYWLRSQRTPTDRIVFTPKFSLADLSKKYGVPAGTIGRMVSKNSYITSVNCHCTQCGIPHRFTSRSTLATQRATLKKSPCASCAAESEAIRRSNIGTALRTHFDRACDSTPAKDLLTLEDLALLDAAICCWGADHNPMYLETEPMHDRNVTYSPCPSSDSAFFRRLVERHLIVLTPIVDLNPDATLIEGRLRYPTLGSHYTLLVDPQVIVTRLYPENRLPLILELDDDEGFWSFCQSLILAECFHFLEFQLVQHSFKEYPVAKTKEALLQCLQHFCAAQVYNLIFQSVKKAKHYQQQARVPRRHAANTIPGNLQRLLSRALERDTDIRPFNRLYHKAPSSLSVTVFDNLLNIEEGGFRFTLTELKARHRSTMINAVRESLH